MATGLTAGLVFPDNFVFHEDTSTVNNICCGNEVVHWQLSLYSFFFVILRDKKSLIRLDARCHDLVMTELRFAFLF
jgi:hypothetical protein